MKTNEETVLKPLRDMLALLDREGHRQDSCEKVTTTKAAVHQINYSRYVLRDGRTFVIQIQWTGMPWESDVSGWEVYLPAADTNSVPDTLAALRSWVEEPQRKREERQTYLRHVLVLSLAAEPGALLHGWRLRGRIEGVLAWVHMHSSLSVYATPGWNGRLDGLTVEVYSHNEAEPLRTEHLDVEWAGNLPTDMATYRAAMERFLVTLPVSDEPIGAVEG